MIQQEMKFSTLHQRCHPNLQFSSSSPPPSKMPSKASSPLPSSPHQDSIVSLMREGAMSGSTADEITAALQAQARQRELKKLLHRSRRSLPSAVKRCNSNSSITSSSRSIGSRGSSIKKNSKSKPTILTKKVNKKVSFALNPATIPQETRTAAAAAAAVEASSPTVVSTAASPHQQQEQRNGNNNNGGLDLLVQVVLQKEFNSLKCTASPPTPTTTAANNQLRITIPTPPTAAGFAAPATTTVATNEDDTDDESVWLQHFNALVSYRDSTGNYDVPPSYVDPQTGLPLGTWVVQQRQDLSELYRHRNDQAKMMKSLTLLRRMQALKRIGFRSPEEAAEEAEYKYRSPPTLNDWDRGLLKFIVPFIKDKKSKNDDADKAEPEREAWIEQQRHKYSHVVESAAASSSSESDSSSTLLSSSTTSGLIVDSSDPSDIYNAVQAKFRVNLLKQLGVDLNTNSKNKDNDDKDQMRD